MNAPPVADQAITGMSPGLADEERTSAVRSRVSPAEPVFGLTRICCTCRGVEVPSPASTTGSSLPHAPTANPTRPAITNRPNRSFFFKTANLQLDRRPGAQPRARPTLAIETELQGGVVATNDTRPSRWFSSAFCGAAAPWGRRRPGTKKARRRFPPPARFVARSRVSTNTCRPCRPRRRAAPLLFPLPECR